MKIGIAADHAGFEYKEYLLKELLAEGYELNDYGTHSTSSMDYPDVVHPLAKDLEEGQLSLGILLCGSANGVAMTANKHQGVRAAICWMPELAKLAREHNDANIICLPARFVSKELALEMARTFLITNFEGGRHERRVNKISC